MRCVLPAMRVCGVGRHRFAAWARYRDKVGCPPLCCLGRRLGCDDQRCDDLLCEGRCSGRGPRAVQWSRERHALHARTCLRSYPARQQAQGGRLCHGGPSGATLQRGRQPVARSRLRPLLPRQLPAQADWQRAACMARAMAAFAWCISPACLHAGVITEQPCRLMFAGEPAPWHSISRQPFHHHDMLLEVTGQAG